MAKGASIKFKSYEATIPKILDFVNLQQELAKHDKIILKPSLKNSDLQDPENTNPNFVEAVLQFCLENKNPVAEVFIAEGADGFDTLELFEALGYRELAEKYSVGLIDLNNTEVEETELYDFLKFNKIMYPAILKNGFVISLPALAENPEHDISASLSNMLGAFPSKYYSGIFSSTKNKIRKWPMKYSIYDIIKCKLPEFALIDASAHGRIFAGLPLEIDKQACSLLDKNWKEVSHLNLIEEALSEKEEFEDDFELEY